MKISARVEQSQGSLVVQPLLASVDSGILASWESPELGFLSFSISGTSVLDTTPQNSPPKKRLDLDQFPRNRSPAPGTRRPASGAAPQGTSASGQCCCWARSWCWCCTPATLTEIGWTRFFPCFAWTCPFFILRCGSRGNGGCMPHQNSAFVLDSMSPYIYIYILVGRESALDQRCDFGCM